jgi:hypothetical protein
MVREEGDLDVSGDYVMGFIRYGMGKEEDLEGERISKYYAV